MCVSWRLHTCTSLAHETSHEDPGHFPCLDIFMIYIYRFTNVFHLQMGLLDSLSGVLPDTSVLLVFLCVLLLSTWFLFSRRNLPPGPWGNLIFGHILDIEGSPDYHLTLLEFRYGKLSPNQNAHTHRMLLNWDLNKIATVLKTTFSNSFSKWKILYFDAIFIDVCFWCSN